MALSDYFPTFSQAFRGGARGLLASFFRYPPLKSTPVWRADSLSSQQNALQRVLAVAAAERLEAAPLVRALAREHRGQYQLWLRRLARRLEAGTPLADALEQTPGVLTDEQSLAVRFADHSGMLTPTLNGLSSPAGHADLPVSERVQQLSAYVVITAIVFLLIMSFFMLKIVPSFQAIFDDFDLRLPPITISMIEASQWAVEYWWVIALIVILIGWPIVSQSMRRFFSRQISSRLIRPIAQLRIANVLALLAESSRAGRPLTGAISTLARYHFDPSIRHKLLFVRNEMEQGADPWQSLATAKLVSAAESAALAKATSSEARAWTMERLARIKRRQVERRINWYVWLLHPAFTLAFAAVVLFVAVACITPLYKMVEALAG